MHQMFGITSYSPSYFLCIVQNYGPRVSTIALSVKESGKFGLWLFKPKNFYKDYLLWKFAF